MKHIIRLFQNMSFAKKFIMLILVAGFIPVILVSLINVIYIAGITEENTIYSMNQGYDQIAQTIENKLDSMSSLSIQLSVNAAIDKVFSMEPEELDTSEQIYYFESINEYTDSMMAGANVKKIYFYINPRFVVINDTGNRYRSLDAVQKMPWYEAYESNGCPPTWLTFQENSAYNQSVEYYGIVRSVWDDTDYTKQVGIIVVMSDVHELKSYLNGTVEGELLILQSDDSSVLVMNDETAAMLPVVTDLPDNMDVFTEITYQKKAYYVRKAEIGDTNITLSSFIPKQSIRGNADKSISIVMKMCFFFTIWIMLCGTMFSRMTTRRLASLTRHMQSVTRKEEKIQRLDYFKSEDYTDEIGELIKSYNYLVAKMNRLMEQQYALGIEKKGAELQALQSQINPHFLYNTLDMIGWLSKKGENQIITEIVQAMATYYRLVLSKGSDIITIGNEINMCNAYMEIQNRRFRGKIQYEVDIQPEIERYSIPKITLQPFIENAILHGIREKESGRGVVAVNGWMEEEHITLSVTDDGNGMNAQQIENLSNEGNHYGLSNVKRRLALYYKKEIPIHIESSPGIGTCVYIEIPKCLEGQDDEKI